MLKWTLLSQRLTPSLVCYGVHLHILKKVCYISFVRPLLEHAVSAWSPYLRGDIDKMERVQRRATKLIPSLRGFCYKDRLKRLNMQSLEDRRIRGDLIQKYKISNGLDIVNWYNPSS